MLLLFFVFVGTIITHYTSGFLFSSSSSSSKPKLTLDEFFNYTEFSSLTLAPDGNQVILIGTRHHNWNQRTTEQHLHLQTLDGKNRKLVTRNASKYGRPRWQNEWIAYVVEKESNIFPYKEEYYIYLYSTRTEQRFSLAFGSKPIQAFTWSHTNNSLYFATQSSWPDEVKTAYWNEWKDVIDDRRMVQGTTIYRLNIEYLPKIQIEIVTNISLSVFEMICSPTGKYLMFSTSSTSEEMESSEIYSLNLTNHSSSVPFRWTNNHATKEHLKWFNDETIFFTVASEGSSIEDEYRKTQKRLYSLNLANGQVDRWADQFTGEVTDFAFLEQGRKGVVILGQLGTEVQIYTQQSSQSPLIKSTGWNGTYEMIVTVSAGNSSTIAFIHSSFDVPQEVYWIDTIDRVDSAQPVTNENKLFTERNLPKGTSYRWLNEEDGTVIEGILLYPPDKFQQKNLSLLVLIHGGPHAADLNVFHANWHSCAAMMATEDWLVFQPNYRGSSGYGDTFLNGVLLEMVSRPGKDILFGVSALVRDGIANSKRLAIGGYSYGGYLTNWLITQTTRFNAALSGGGSVEQVTDLTSNAFLGGFPWDVPDLYQQQSAIFQLDKVRTPTQIFTGAHDVTVPAAQSYILEKFLHVLNIKSKLIVFPNEGHNIDQNPWHGKIKVREELKWLNKYGNISLSTSLRRTYNICANARWTQDGTTVIKSDDGYSSQQWQTSVPLFEFKSESSPNSEDRQKNSTLFEAESSSSQLSFESGSSPSPGSALPSSDWLETLSSPYGLYVDDNETVYIADRFNHRIMELKRDATSAQTIAGGHGNGSASDQLSEPVDVIIDKDGSLIICDAVNLRVVHWPRGAQNGTTIIANIGCWGLAMDDQESLYVSDWRNDDVSKWPVGKTKRTVMAGGNGEGNGLNQLNGPRFLVVDQDHSVYVADMYNHRVMKWIEGAKEGIIVAGGEGQGNGLAQLSHPIGVVVDQQQAVYVVDFDNNRIVRWLRGAEEGSVVVGGNGNGTEMNQFDEPTNLTFDQHGNLYVSDTSNMRVQKFEIDTSLCV